MRRLRQHDRESAATGDTAVGGHAVAAASGVSNAALARLLCSAAPGRPQSGGQLDPSVASAIEQARRGGAPMAQAAQIDLGQAFSADLSSVRIHTDDRADQLNRAVGARAFTVGSDIFFSRGAYDPAPGPGRELLAHEMTHVVQQAGVTGAAAAVSDPADPTEVQAMQVGRLLASGTGIAAGTASGPVVGRAVSNRALAGFLGGDVVRAGTVVQRQPTDTQTDVQRLDEMLDRFNVPESEVIALIRGMSSGDKATVATPAYRQSIADALDFGEMAQVVAVLPLPLPQKLEWLRAAAVLIRAIGYDEIQSLVTAAPQGERDALKTDAWLGFFVQVCTNATMVTALNDLHFDLATKLTWLRAEMTWTRAELDYATIQPWITAAPQGERDALKTDTWLGFFVQVCTNATMGTAVKDLQFPLPDKLRWLMAEGSGYEVFKAVIIAAADKPAALADQALLVQVESHLGWDEFAMCVELLGRVIPGPADLLANAAVQAALASAWTASNAAVTSAPPAPPTPGVHEEGGFIYLDIITNTITTDRVAAGAQASLPLNDPNPPAHAVTVGGFHTHPNVGPDWGAPFASGADIGWATRNGIPLLIRGAFPTPATTSDTSTGSARGHLAGERGFPGTTGGTAPQASLDGGLDEV